jgi:hypothetical protein
VAEISNAAGSKGKASTKAVGTTAVQATDPQTNVSGQTRLDVTAAVIQKLEIAPGKASLRSGQWQQFTGTGTFSDGTTHDLTGSASCSSPDAAAAPVPGYDCRFYGVNPGPNEVATATITATFDGATATATLAVSRAQLLEVMVLACDPDPSACADVDSFKVIVGQNTVFMAIGRYTDTDTLKGGVWDDITKFVAWDSSAATVAQVSNDLLRIGTVTGLSAGETTITAVDPTTLLNDSVKLVVAAKP